MNTQNATGEIKIKKETWPYPLPLTPEIAPDIPYPVEALPKMIKEPVLNYHAYGRPPIPLIVSSALANISLACQSLANVARDRSLISPVSLYFLMVADSGERKSAIDNMFSKAVREWESRFHKKRARDVQVALSLHHAWQMEKDGLLSQIKRASFSGENTSYLKMELAYIFENEPDIPLLPSLYFEDATQEALAVHLANGWPSSALWSDEAGIVLGSHSMQSNPTRFVAVLNRLWEGKTFSTHRKTSQNFTIQNRRLTVNLMMQPMLLKQLSAQALGIHRQSGFLARCLVAYPGSAMGERFYQEPPEDNNKNEAFNKRLTDCLEQTEELTREGCIDLPVLQLSPTAKQKWIRFFNETEAGISPKGQWREIKDFASKALENTARLAALFHLFGGFEGDIQPESMEQAIEIIHWHLQETRRLLSTYATGENVSDAETLSEWLINKEIETISIRDIQRLSPLRDKNRRNDAIEKLLEHHYVRLIKIDGKSSLAINPYLL